MAVSVHPSDQPGRDCLIADLQEMASQPAGGHPCPGHGRQPCRSAGHPARGPAERGGRVADSSQLLPRRPRGHPRPPGSPGRG
eukprot:11313878-Alexandrium_andersonii.AAC.1